MENRSSVERLFYGDGDEEEEPGVKEKLPCGSYDGMPEPETSGIKAPEESSGRESRKERKARKKAEEEKKRSKHPRLYDLLDWVKVIIIAFVVALFLNYVVVINSTVPSGSMEPTIMTGSRMIGLRLSYTFSEPERGDIIIFKYPDDTSQNFVKRIIGLPGETVEIIDGVTYIDGVALEEDYLAETPYEEDFGPYVVPEGCYFVMGDNRNNSKDSRYWENTFVPEDYIIGKALFCYWPLGYAGILE